MIKGEHTLARQIRTAARVRLRESKTLWKEYKRRRRSIFRQELNQIGLQFILFSLLVFAVVVRTNDLPLLLLVLAVYSTATTFGRSASLQTALYRSGELGFFMHMPVTDVFFFDLMWKKSLRSSALLWCYSFLVFGYVTAFATPGYPRIWAAAAAAATLQWLLVVSLVVAIEVAIPERRLLKFTWVLYPLTLAIAFAPPWLAAAVRPLFYITPWGWVPFAFQRGIVGGVSDVWFVLVPSAILLSTLAFTVPRFRKSYPREELRYPFMPAQGSTDTVQPFEDTFESEAHEQPHAEHLPQIQFLALNWDKSGPIERLAGRWLTPLERSIAEFMLGGELGLWSAQWKRGAKVGAVCLVAMIVPQVDPGILIFLTAIPCMFGLPVLGGLWAGMQLVPASGMVMPRYASFPISYSQISRIMVKVNLLRFACWLPPFFMLTLALAWRTHTPLGEGFGRGAQILFLLVAIQPLAIIGQHSQGTNDSRIFNSQIALAAIVVIILGILSLASIMAFFVEGNWAPAEGRLLMTLGISTILVSLHSTAWLLYKVLYNRGRVDLIRSPKS